MSLGRILVIEDEADILELVAYNLDKNGYEVIRATTGENGLAQAQAQLPHMVLLDLMLPGIDGYEVCQKLKSNSVTKNIPVIMLTAKSEDTDIIAGLEMGADDYLPKPFSPKVLAARVKSLLRRTQESISSKGGEGQLFIHGILLDSVRHEVSVDGEFINLSATEFAILKHVAAHPGWVFSRNQIIDAVRGGNYPVTERSVDVQILGLRKKLGNKGKYIETVRGIGYKMRGVA